MEDLHVCEGWAGIFWDRGAIRGEGVEIGSGLNKVVRKMFTSREPLG